MNILFADDESLVFSIFRHHLAQYGSPFVVPYFARSGEELVKQFRTVSPSVVFTDICMPGLNGLEAIDEIKNEYGECASFYVFSGYDEFEYARHALRSGVKDYLSKPVHYQTFCKILKGEEEMYFSGIPLKTAWATNDESKALYLSRTASSLASAYSSGNLSWFEEILKKWKEEDTAMEEKFFLSHFGSRIGEKEEQEKILGKCLERLKIQTSRTQSRTAEILGYINRNYDSPMISLDTIATKFGYSLQYLSSSIKRETKEGFSEYITKKRIEKAKLLLSETEMTVSDIAMDCGYSYSNYFIKVFSKKEGMTPQEWRKKARNSPGSR